MKNKVILLALVAAFGLGFSFDRVITPQPAPHLKRVTSIGGIFFKCNDPAAVRAWYKAHLGIATNDYGAVFEWKHAEDPTKKGFSQWSPFPAKTKYFAPSTKDFMINYRVEDLDALVVELKNEGVTILDTVETYDYGKFVHILDPEQNKIELWQPNDEEYDKLGKNMGAETTK